MCRRLLQTEQHDQAPEEKQAVRKVRHSQAEKQAAAAALIQRAWRALKARRRLKVRFFPHPLTIARTGSCILMSMLRQTTAAIEQAQHI